LSDEFVDPRELADQLIAQGREAEAAAAFRSMLDAGRGGLLTRIAYSRALIALGATERAVEAAREAAQLAPGVLDAAMAFADALAADANLTSAVAEYQRAARLDPSALEPQVAVARLWADIGEWDKAEDTLARAEGLGADGAKLRAQIAEGRKAKRFGENFVRHLFDQFSADYDERMLGRLGYSAPAILRDLAAMYWGPKPKVGTVLDLGCGTGLSGRAFADIHHGALIGVDLSPKMLAKAKETLLYDDLQQADIETWLETAPERAFDTVIAADVFVYLGELEPAFRGVSRVLVTGGEFLFTVERGEGADFALGERRRWRHSEEYLRRLAKDHRFEPASLIVATLRHDAGAPVEGLAALFVKT
jgi:predicted TPR repeat methyltransferase